MSRRLVIAGAGGFGRELQLWIETSPRWRAEVGVTEVVFIDDGTPTTPVLAPIIGTVKDYTPASDDVLLCAVAVPSVRQSMTSALRGRGARFATFHHDRSIIGSRERIGEGSVICPDVIVTSDVIIGESAQINTACGIGHDVRIGSFVTLSSRCSLTGGVVVGDRAFFGTAATVIPGITVGADAVVGAGSVVLKPVMEGVTVFGNPSRRVR